MSASVSGSDERIEDPSERNRRRGGRHDAADKKTPVRLPHRVLERARVMVGETLESGGLAPARRTRQREPDIRVLAGHRVERRGAGDVRVRVHQRRERCNQGPRQHLRLQPLAEAELPNGQRHGLARIRLRKARSTPARRWAVRGCSSLSRPLKPTPRACAGRFISSRWTTERASPWPPTASGNASSKGSAPGAPAYPARDRRRGRPAAETGRARHPRRPRRRPFRLPGLGAALPTGLGPGRSRYPRDRGGRDPFTRRGVVFHVVSPLISQIVLGREEGVFSDCFMR